MKRKEKLEIDLISKYMDQETGTIIQITVDELAPVLIDLLKNEMTPELKQITRNYLIIRLVTMIETYFRSMVRMTIDTLQFEFMGIFPNDEIKISLLDLKEIKKNEKITEGRIISSSFNFQNLDEIDSVMSKLFGKSFFGEISKKITKYSFSKMHPKGYGFDWKEIRELFQIRHDVVHRMENVQNLNEQKLLRFTSHALVLCSLSQIIQTEEFVKRQGKELRTSLPAKFEHMVDTLKNLEDALS